MPKFLILTLLLLNSIKAFGLYTFEVQGHRGARAERPENTISAFEYALNLGVDTLELDLNVTKDDVLVITHDPHINFGICKLDSGFTFRKKILVRNLTVAQIKKYDCGSKKNFWFPKQVPQPHERIPTFEEFLIWLTTHPSPFARTVKLNIETKSELAHPEYAPEPLKFSGMVLSLLKKYGMFSRSTLQSFDYRTLLAARALDPSTRISALMNNRPKSFPDLVNTLKMDIVSINHQKLRLQDVEVLHQLGVQVIPWTPNSVTSWKRLVNMGVDGMISDDPRRLLLFRDSL
ncbi:MAG: glycerophosphodiester phosphodiesterase family protein [Bdellovibrionota bacterium]